MEGGKMSGNQIFAIVVLAIFGIFIAPHIIEYWLAVKREKTMQETLKVLQDALDRHGETFIHKNPLE
jgi:hypothetical protein